MMKELYVYNLISSDCGKYSMRNCLYPDRQGLHPRRDVRYSHRPPHRLLQPHHGHLKDVANPMPTPGSRREPPPGGSAGRGAVIWRRLQGWGCTDRGRSHPLRGVPPEWALPRLSSDAARGRVDWSPRSGTPRPRAACPRSISRHRPCPRERYRDSRTRPVRRPRAR